MTVTVYTRDACPGCKATKNHLAKLGIDFDEVHVALDDEPLMAAIDELGYSSVPVVCASTAEGETHWSGYRPDRIDALVRAA